MTQPTFTLTKKVPVTLYRKIPGYRLNGKWVEGEETQLVIQANIQPLKPYEIMIMPEADRTRSWLKGYTTGDIRTLDEQQDGISADEFYWLGQRYKVMSIERWVMGVQDHTKFRACRLEITPN